MAGYRIECTYCHAVRWRDAPGYRLCERCEVLRLSRAERRLLQTLKPPTFRRDKGEVWLVFFIGLLLGFVLGWGGHLFFGGHYPQ